VKSSNQIPEDNEDRDVAGAEVQEKMRNDERGETYWNANTVRNNCRRPNRRMVFASITVAFFARVFDFKDNDIAPIRDPG